MDRLRPIHFLFLGVVKIQRVRDIYNKTGKLIVSDGTIGFGGWDILGVPGTFFFPIMKKDCMGNLVVPFAINVRNGKTRRGNSTWRIEDFMLIVEEAEKCGLAEKIPDEEIHLYE